MDGEQLEKDIKLSKFLFILSSHCFNPPMVKPFRLAYLAKGGGGLSLNDCLPDFLLVVNL